MCWDQATSHRLSWRLLYSSAECCALRADQTLQHYCRTKWKINMLAAGVSSCMHGHGDQKALYDAS